MFSAAEYKEINSTSKRRAASTLAVVGFVGVVAVAAVAGGSMLGSSLAAMRAPAVAPAIAPAFAPAMDHRRVACNAQGNFKRRTRKTLEKVDMPTDITVLGPDPLQRKQYYPKLQDAKGAKETWFVLDAKDQVLGRLASLAATLVMGKTNPLFQNSMNMGAHVVIINADKVRVTGRKYTDKLYKRHATGRPGSMKTETFRDLQQRIPERIVEKAIRGMLPHTRLGREQFKQLHIYAGEDNPHAAQQPTDVTYKISSPAKKAYIKDRETVQA